MTQMTLPTALSEIHALDVEALVSILQDLNQAYREGSPLVDDDVYDTVYLARLRAIAPDHPFLNQVEPEAVAGKVVRHSTPMLSTEKAYLDEEVEAWVARVLEAADGKPATVRVMAKLDGIAGTLRDGVLATRGNGTFGQDVSRVLKAGLVYEASNEGPGEIVVDQCYFEEQIRDRYDMKHPRNYMAGLIGADEVKAHHREALEAGACRFVRYDTLPAIEMPVAELTGRWKAILASVREGCDYLTDGAVVEVVQPEIREALGATSHHHRWMLALKEKGEMAQTEIESITMQCGRSGRLTPVLEVKPVFLSGATISRCTAHTARHVTRLGLGPGAKITLIRSGEVIPKLVSVEVTSTQVPEMNACPSCGSTPEWDNDYLVCGNAANCSAQASGKLQHFFARLGIKGFGPSICDKLADAGHTELDTVTALNRDAMVAAGISPGVAENLLAAIAERKGEIIKDNDAVASFGVHHFGRGDSRKVLEVHAWQTFHQLTAADLVAIPGFGALTASEIAPYLARIYRGLTALVAQGFTIEATVRPSDVADSAIKGKKIVFTGSMARPREEMEQEAREKGATVQSGVSKTTDLLVFGDKAGSKVEKAAALGVKTIPVADYLQMIA